MQENFLNDISLRFPAFNEWTYKFLHFVISQNVILNITLLMQGQRSLMIYNGNRMLDLLQIALEGKKSYLQFIYSRVKRCLLIQNYLLYILVWKKQKRKKRSDIFGIFIYRIAFWLFNGNGCFFWVFFKKFYLQKKEPIWI